MKSFLIILCCVLLVLTSCSKDENIPQVHKSYIVSIIPQAELSSSFPETKVTSNDIYGVEVYAKSSAVSDAPYYPYASGYFDDLSMLSLKLYDNYKYKTTLTFIKNAKNILKKTDKEEYFNPFEIKDKQSVTIQNKFTYSGPEYLASASYTDLADGKGYGRAPIDRFYGENTDFTPSEDNKTISIAEKRVSYGINFVPEGLTDGNLKITLDNSADVIINANSNAQPQQQVIMCTPFILKAYDFVESGTNYYTDPINITITWNRDCGDVFQIYTGQITAKRNQMETITIKIKDPTKFGGVSLTGLDEQFQNGDSFAIGNE